jgi:spectinomycin phosphotransferase
VLRHEEHLGFVVAALKAHDGRLLRRLEDRYALSVFPLLRGRSFAFGTYTDQRLRSQALEMIATLHRCTSAVRDRAPRHVPGYAGQAELIAFLGEPERAWYGGPFSEGARLLFAGQAGGLAELVLGFAHLVDLTASARSETVITHGEPHPANFMTVDGGLVLLDWVTAALAPPERDVAPITTARSECVERYEQATGRRIDDDVVTLYRLRWYLDDLGSAIRLFRNPHHESPDTRSWWEGLAPRLEQLPDVARSHRLTARSGVSAPRQTPDPA